MQIRVVKLYEDFFGKSIGFGSTRAVMALNVERPFAKVCCGDDEHTWKS
jgi:hypothetical protein